MSEPILPIYLDYNATTPVHPEVAEAMRPCLEGNFGNPSSTHAYGRAADAAVRSAREQVARLLGCDAGEIVFTSGGTESDNHALKGYAFANAGRGRHIITSAVEHPAVLNVCHYLERHGFQVTYVPVDGTGMVQPDTVASAIRDDTILISIMHANNEVGTIQPIRRISELARSRDIVVHTDAAQSLGKIPCRVDELDVDMLTVAGHKLYAPKGVGALYLRNGLQLEPLLHGAGHERGRRASTENVPGIVGLGKACELLTRADGQRHEPLKQSRDRLHARLLASIPDLRLNGHMEQRLPNTLNVSFRGINASDLLGVLCDSVAASGGAACHDNSVEISQVLKAMGVPREWAVGTIRFTTGTFTTAAEIDTAADLIAAAVAKLRAQHR